MVRKCELKEKNTMYYVCLVCVMFNCKFLHNDIGLIRTRCELRFFPCIFVECYSMWYMYLDTKLVWYRKTSGGDGIALSLRV